MEKKDYKYKINMILPYFLNGKGAWPEYIDWHLASCKANETIDYYIFTDDHSIDKWNAISNIHIVNMSFDECINLIHSKLGDVKIDTPYKMCDYRPAYGVIFEDYIKGCDFWGFYDCDLIYGNMRHYFTDELLEQYDKFMILGHTQLYRNSEEANHFYCLKRPDDSKYKDYTWEQVSGTTKHFGYDEWSGAPQLIRENGKRIYWEREIFSNIYQPVMYKKVFDKNVGFNKPFQVWLWEDGALYHVDTFTKKKRERMYIHLTHRKMKFVPYNNQTRAYITQKSEIKESLSFGDGYTGFEFIKIYTKKIFIWIGWHLTHLKGKKSWEM